jgi:hypothetical protein
MSRHDGLYISNAILAPPPQPLTSGEVYAREEHVEDEVQVEVIEEQERCD